MSGSREALFTLTKVRGTRRREANAQVEENEEKRSFLLPGSAAISTENFYLLDPRSYSCLSFKFVNEFLIFH